MSEFSNPTRRVLDVLSFLAAHPTDSFTLAEIAHHLGQSRASAYRVLMTMTEAQFLSRHPKHKTYSLGVTPIAIGQAAIAKHRGVEIAHREMARLATQLAVQCSATAVVDNDLLVLIMEGLPLLQEETTRVGERPLLIPPFGICHYAWASPREQEIYLARGTGRMSEAMRCHLAEALAMVRERGYAMAANGQGMRALRKARLGGMNQSRQDELVACVLDLVGGLSRDELQLTRAGDAGAEGVSYIAAPVFSPSGAVSLQLVITGVPAHLDGRAINHLAERLCASAAVVTNEIRGSRPEE